jgi:hypothetical protein
MDTGDVRETGRLLRERAEREWLRGEPVLATGPVDHVVEGRYKVRGLDAEGNPPPPVVDRVFDAFDEHAQRTGVFTVVRGDHPGCVAVFAYRATRYDNTWLVVTPSRVAVLRLRDVQNRADHLDSEEARVEATRDRSVGGLLRGVGKLMASSAAEIARSVRRPPLVERPGDAVLECPFEAPSSALAGVSPWKPRGVPRLKHGPRYVQVAFADGSSACFTTDAAGEASLTGRPG